MTPEKVAGIIVAAILVLGLTVMGLVELLRKLGFGKIEAENLHVECPGVCPDPECQNLVKDTRESVIRLEEGQNFVKQQLEDKRKQIQLLQGDSSEIKTDVKWLRSHMMDWLKKNG